MIISSQMIYENILKIKFSPIPDKYEESNMYCLWVEYRGDDNWAITRYNRRMNKQGFLDLEPSPSHRTEEWIAEHSFSLEEAKKIAREKCLNITVNGKTFKDALAMAFENENADDSE